MDISYGFFIFFIIMVCCVYSLESPQRSDSNEYTQHTFHDIISLGSQENFLGTQKRVRISYCKRAIGVRIIEVLLFLIR